MAQEGKVSCSHPINDEVRGLPRCVWLWDTRLGDLLNAVSLLLQEVCPACVMLKPSANVRVSFIDGSRPWAASRTPEAPESKLWLWLKFIYQAW